jgi:flagellar motor switch/type III secretory pathway protein FliN
MPDDTRLATIPREAIADGAGELWNSCKQLPCVLTLELPVPQFTLRQMLELRTGSVIDTRWSQAADIPLRVNGELLAWSEFEVVDDRYGVRLTELT